MKKPLVSIIIPVFNTGKACLELLDALQLSTYKNIEIICIDDGSKDDSYKLLRNYATKHKNMTVRTQKNAGPSAARNAGIKLATGDFIAFIDSDDLVDKTYIEKLVSAYDDKTILACTALQYNRLALNKSYPDFMKQLRDKKPNESIKDYVLYIMLRDGRLYSSVNKLFRKDIIANFDLQFDASLNFAEDTKFVLDYINAIISKCPEYTTIKMVYEPLYIYNYGTETSTVSKSSLDWKNWRKSYENLNAWLGTKPSLVARWRRFLILCRWKISHALAVARSKKSFRDKCRHENPIVLLGAELIVRIRG